VSTGGSGSISGRLIKSRQAKIPVKQTSTIHIFTDCPSATSHVFPGQATCHQPLTSSYPVYFVYYPEEDEEELQLARVQLEALAFFNPGAEQDAKAHHACLPPGSRASRSRATGSSTKA
jgi:hypothetical protein